MMIRIRATRHDTLAWIGDIGESVEQREDPHRGCLLRRLAAPYPYPEKWNRSEWQRHMRLPGMGLSICRSIIKPHDGQLWGAVRHEGGTVFSFTLPFAPEDSFEA